MSYRELIYLLPVQFKYQPEIINKENLRPFKHIIIAGMGGSRLGPDVLNMLRPSLDIHVCSSGELPILSPEYLGEAIVIANSHSGNTTETLAVARQAFDMKLNLAVVTCGGELAAFAKEYALPHIITPTAGEPARLGIGYSLVALAHLVGLGADIFEGWEAPISQAPVQQSTDIAGVLDGGIPLIYCVGERQQLGYVWKTILNETAKVPSFCNRYPELLHNEIASYDSVLAQQLRVLIIGTHEQLEAFLKDKNIAHISVPLASPIDMIILAHLTALVLSEKTGVDPISTPAIDEFKNLS